MKQPFEFRAFNGGKIYKVYSVQRLMNLCRQYPEDAYNHLWHGHIEKWLDYIEEYEAAEVARENNNNTKEFCEKTEEFLENRTILNTLEKAIEITLKEYETLKQELVEYFYQDTGRKNNYLQLNKFYKEIFAQDKHKNSNSTKP